MKYLPYILILGLVAGGFWLLRDKSEPIALGGELGATQSGLVGWWTFDGRDTVWTSATAATTLDKSGNGNTGTLTNMNQATAPAPGKLGQALRFVNNITTTGGYVNIPFSGPLTFRDNAPITISAWIRPSTDSVPCALDCRIVDQVNAIVLRWEITNKRVNFIIPSFSGNKSVTTATNSVQPNSWYHVVGLYDGTNIIVYINGNQSGSTQPTGTYNGDSSNWRITRSDQVQTFPGLIDDVRIYNRALSAEEIRDLYRYGLSTNLRN